MVRAWHVRVLFRETRAGIGPLSRDPHLQGLGLSLVQSVKETRTQQSRAANGVKPTSLDTSKATGYAKQHADQESRSNEQLRA